MISRTAIRDIDVDGYRVAAGSVTFDPGRFGPEQVRQRDRWQYLPFGAGPRSCIGDHFAMLEATLALATIIGRCQIGSLSDDFPIAVPFTTVASQPVPALVVKR